MNDRPLTLVIKALYAHGCDPKQNGKGFKAKCPAHNDRNPSLSISEGDDGRALVKCHSNKGCTTERIVKAIDLTMRDLMPVDSVDVDRTPRSKPRSKVVSTSTPAKQLFPTVAEAVSHLEKSRGKRSNVWTYTNADGNPVGVIVRWDKSDGDKDILPVSRNGDGWIIGGMPTPRPLYSLPDLDTAIRVYVAEGEKAADALRSVGLTATTSPHGCKSAKQAEWSPVASKSVVILPDNDEAGAGYRDDVIACLSKLTPAPTVCVVELPDLPDRGDAFDFIEARRAAGDDDDAIRKKIEAMADVAELVALHRPTSPVSGFRPFPTDVLPDPLGWIVKQAAHAIGCDMSYVALPLLSAIGAAIGNTRRIQLKKGWSEPAIIWTACVGKSGSQKTPAFKLVMQPIRDRQGKALQCHNEAMELYESELATYERDYLNWKKKGNGDPPQKPQPPQADRFIVSDTTVEAMSPILLANPRGVLMARDELSGWFGAFNRYNGKAGADESHWLSMFNAESMIVDRKTGMNRAIYVPSAYVCISGGIQPGILRKTLTSEHRESGMAARLLMAWPPMRPKRWTEAEVSDHLTRELTGVLDGLFALNHDVNAEGDPIPRILPLTPAGKTAWIAFYNAHNAEQSEMDGDLSAAWSKLEGYAARFALLVHCVRMVTSDPTLADPDLIDEKSVAAGVALSQWFGHEAKRIYGMLAEDEDDRKCRELDDLIQSKGGNITARELMRCKGGYPKAEDADAALQMLVENGWGVWEHVTPGKAGGAPTKRFVRFDGADTDTTPVSSAVSGGIVNVNGVNDDDWGKL